jgi:hypothetical protein
MAHRFRVYEVDPEGRRTDKGVVIEVWVLPAFNEFGNVSSPGDVVIQLCLLFKSDFAPQGFTQYVHHWKPRKPVRNPFIGTKHKEGDIEITYDFGPGHDGISTGVKPVFFLERGG